MKAKLIILLIFMLLIVSCRKDKDESESDNQSNYKDEMQNFVIGISQYSKSISPGFLIIPQNGQELITSDGNEDGPLATAYLIAIDGLGREDLFYGYDNDDVATPAADRDYMISYLDRAKQEGKRILVTDYCFTQSKMLDSYTQNNNAGYVSFAADHRDLNNIPAYPSSLFNQNSNDVSSLTGVMNFLFLIDPSAFTKGQFIQAVRNTNYDLIIIDLFINDEEFSPAEIDSLKQKKDGGKRLVICYMSIGEAENYRYYWQSGWNTNKPAWLEEENPSWPGNYAVKYWDKNWQNIIFGNDQSYTKRILNAHFDGVYLDKIDSFEYFEQ
jgi:cysteinyl-tRNA synthetase, unknown class